MEIIPQLLFVLLLVFLNGFFVASEFALVAIRKTKIEELVRRGNPAARMVKRALEDLDSYISATQLGITLASLGLGWVGEPALAHFFQPFFSFLPEQGAYISAHALASIAAFSIITFLHIVLGELAPKTVALERSETVSLFVIVPLTIFAKVFWPFIFILNGAGSLVLRIFGFHAPTGHQLVHSEEEIRMLLDQSGATGTISRKEVEMVQNVFKLGETPVKFIMVPRTDIIAFDTQTPLSTVVAKIEKHIHSRFPVYEHSIDTIVGFIHVKDIYKATLKKNGDKKIAQTTLIREILHVPETKKADAVLLDMRKKRIHLAVVNDEYGGTAGIVTLEDVIESLVGEIQDEFEKPIAQFAKEPGGSYLIDGRVPIDQVQQKFRIALRGQAYATIGGLVFGLLAHEPKKGDVVQIGPVIFEVAEVEHERIKTVRLKKERK